ncbi:DUF5309 domain-containing protein [bacterium]|nr:DUF5309 domain-containing protein [bacterium]
MTIIANTFTSFDAKGIREELANVISNIAPEETPFTSNVGSENVSNTFFEWQLDDLSSVDVTPVIDGDDVASFDATTATVRVGNYTQIRRRSMVIADNLGFQDLAGRNDEVAYQLAKRGKEIKRDLETIYTGNTARSAGSASAGRVTAGLGAWIATNVNKAGDGTNPTAVDGSDARNDGTQRDFTEAMLKDVMQQAYTSGGNPSVLMVGPFNKTVVSGFAGIAAQRYQAPTDGPTTIIGAADVYLSDFGALTVVPNRFSRERDAWCLDTEYASIATLRPIQAVDLAKTGDAEKKMLICETGLKVSNEKAHGLIADLNVS